MRVYCTPSQRFKEREIRDRGAALWCSWVLEEMAADGQTDGPKKLSFTGKPLLGILEVGERHQR